MNPRVIMLLIVRFLIGGSVIAAVSLIARTAPRLTGLLAAFPAVFLTALWFIEWLSGKEEAEKFASTAIYGMAGSVLVVAATLIGLISRWPWPLVVLFGGVTYIVFVLAMIIRQLHRTTHTI